MPKPRFFVTYVFFVAMACVVAWGVHQQNPEQDRSSLALEGNQKIAEFKELARTLNARFNFAQAKDLKLEVRPREERRELQVKLAHFLSLVNRALEIGATHGLFFEDRAAVLSLRDRAELWQKSIEEFEKLNGESYQPKRIVQNGARKNPSL